jgi:hypothetical protein
VSWITDVSSEESPYTCDTDVDCAQIQFIFISRRDGDHNFTTSQLVVFLSLVIPLIKG